MRAFDVLAWVYEPLLAPEDEAEAIRRVGAADRDQAWARDRMVEAGLDVTDPVALAGVLAGLGLVATAAVHAHQNGTLGHDEAVGARAIARQIGAALRPYALAAARG